MARGLHVFASILLEDFSRAILVHFQARLLGMNMSSMSSQTPNPIPYALR
jgi:hypothetical protein